MSSSGKKAAHLFLRVGAQKDKVLLLKHRNNKWGTPGGEVDPGETFWQAMKREFREETGVKLPRLSNIQHVDTYQGKVRIYVADLNVPVDTVLPKHMRTSETKGWTTVRISELNGMRSLQNVRPGSAPRRADDVVCGDPAARDRAHYIASRRIVCGSRRKKGGGQRACDYNMR